MFVCRNYEQPLPLKQSLCEHMIKLVEYRLYVTDTPSFSLKSGEFKSVADNHAKPIKMGDTTEMITKKEWTTSEID